MSILTKEGIQKILNDDWLLMDDCEGLENCTVIKELARMALAAMDSEPVFTLEVSQADYKGQKLGNHFGFITLDAARKLKEGNYQLYRHAQPAPVVSEDLYKLANHIASSKSGLPDEWLDWAEELETDIRRAAVLQAGNSPVQSESRCSTKAAPAPDSLPKTAVSRCGNSPVIPDGWTGNDKANAALMMLDRIETVDPVDDDRIDGIKRIVRELAAGPHDTPALNSVQSVVTVPGKLIPVSEQKPDCWCLTCRPVVLNDMRFVVCPDCGNKRCPRANDHRDACTGSNEPGQEGSVYPAAQQEVSNEK